MELSHSSAHVINLGLFNFNILNMKLSRVLNIEFFNFGVQIVDLKLSNSNPSIN